MAVFISGGGTVSLRIIAWFVVLGMVGLPFTRGMMEVDLAAFYDGLDFLGFADMAWLS